ncbi:phage tail assembly chaperone G [Solibacillus sp. FSL H8-0538]|uniref:phage tail assembly chaperone G n=1 Tax=Solibacillus sp. FSL H8-0538 TaxID=2921400 RepID=UPI0030F75611
MKIVVRIKGEDKTFINDFVAARIFRNALALNEKMKDQGTNISVDTFDEMVEFVIAVFNHQFTVDDFYDGVEAYKFQDEIMRVFNSVLNVGGLETVDSEGK